MRTFTEFNIALFQDRISNCFTNAYILSKHTMELLYKYGFIVKYEMLQDEITNTTVVINIIDLTTALIPCEVSIELNRFLYKAKCFTNDIQNIFYGIRHKYFEYESYTDNMLLVKTDQKEYVKIQFDNCHWYLNTNAVLIGFTNDLNDLSIEYFINSDKINFVDYIENTTRYKTDKSFSTVTKNLIVSAYKSKNFVAINVDIITDLDDMLDGFNCEYSGEKYIVIMALNKKEKNIIEEIKKLCLN